MTTGTYRSVIVQRGECAADSESARRQTQAAMDSRDEELELVALFRQDEERRHLMAAMDSWLTGRNQP